ncbi:hypothetical protein AVEN_187492-1 [Araneus ventricosus]|uniref:Uncharacterized protein n=1 Tax=Araneus ventricosus TaxID=182803 RepID=A0A4Y2BRZ5_ARAVE|nr:hypothetical protein AVEN_187492-1 [Araneus ventricosus]
MDLKPLLRYVKVDSASSFYQQVLCQGGIGIKFYQQVLCRGGPDVKFYRHVLCRGGLDVSFLPASSMSSSPEISANDLREKKSGDCRETISLHETASGHVSQSRERISCDWSEMKRDIVPMFNLLMLEQEVALPSRQEDLGLNEKVQT